MALVAFLRGGNVGGHRTFRPKLLVGQLEHLDAVNVGAAGTFVIRRPVTRAKLDAELRRRLPFETEILICEGREIRGLTSRNFFEGHPEGADVVRFVSVLSKVPRPAPPLPFDLPPGGPWQLRVLAREGRCVVGLYRRHMKAIGFLGALDRIFGTPVTTRNWSTMTAVGRVLDEAPRGA